MTNSAIIVKIEYKYQEADAWITIPFISGSAKMDQSHKEEDGGWIYTTKVSFKIAKNEITTVEPIATLLRKKAIYRIIDGNGTKYTLGTDKLKARLNYSVKVEGAPGSFNGRELDIICISDEMLVIE